MKGQTGMVVIVIAMIIVVFIMMFMFLGSFSDETAKTLKGEYRNLFANSLLLAVLETHTGCDQMSELLKCDYFGGCRCAEGFNEKLPQYMKVILNATGHTDYDWLIEVEPRNFQGISKQWGNPYVTATPGYWDARTILTWGGNQIEVKLYIRTK